MVFSTAQAVHWIENTQMYGVAAKRVPALGSLAESVRSVAEQVDMNVNVFSNKVVSKGNDVKGELISAGKVGLDRFSEVTHQVRGRITELKVQAVDQVSKDGSAVVGRLQEGATAAREAALAKAEIAKTYAQSFGELIAAFSLSSSEKVKSFGETDIVKKIPVLERLLASLVLLLVAVANFIRERFVKNTQQEVKEISRVTEESSKQHRKKKST